MADEDGVRKNHYQGLMNICSLIYNSIANHKALSCITGGESLIFVAFTLPALYELETVAQRFGGKYAKKVLAICGFLGDASRTRAKEMGIEIWDMNSSEV